MGWILEAKLLLLVTIKLHLAPTNDDRDPNLACGGEAVL